MAEPAATKPASSTPEQRGALARTGASTLVTDKGSTSIADTVVERIVALAAQEVSGVAHLGGAVGSALAGMVGRIRGSGTPQTTGVGVEVGERQAAVDLTLVVRYPQPVHEVAEAVRENVIARVEAMTGLGVVEVNVVVTDLAFEGDDQQDTPSRVE